MFTRALEELLHILPSSPQVLFCSPAGSGKSTRVPPALLPVLPGKILLLEPRRLAARALAHYMAAQKGERVGQSVGFRTRLESRVSAATRIEVITEGILTRRLQSDPELSGVSCVIFDEFHERSLQADLGLAMCLDVQNSLRPDLKLIIMSATLDIVALQKHLNCPLIQAQGSLFPVSISYHVPSPQQKWEEHLCHCLAQSLAVEKGSALVFLPGSAEIQRCATALPPILARVLASEASKIDLYPLYGDLPPEKQDAAIAPAPAGRRKVVLSTSLAQTSLTIEGIRVVLDAGLHRSSRFDPVLGMSRMVTNRVSQAGASQRAGRAGRLEAGLCLRLWSEQESLRPQERPEILDADLSPLLLELLAWGVPPDRLHSLTWLDAPPAKAVEQAVQTLELVGAMENQALTKHGRELLALPLHPRLGHLALRAREWKLLPLGAALCALLSERDPLRSAEVGVDIGQRLQLFNEQRLPRALRASALQIQALLGHHGPHSAALAPLSPADMDQAGRLLAQAWPERLAQKRSPGSFRLASGRGLMLPVEDRLAREEWLAVAHLDAAKERMFLAAPISRADIEKDFATQIVGTRRIYWDSRQQAVVAQEQVCLGALLLSSQTLQNPADSATASPSNANSAAVSSSNASSANASASAAICAALQEGIRSLGLGVLPWTLELRQWQARVLLLRTLDPRWPDVSDAALIHNLELWLAPYLTGMSRRSHLAQLDLENALLSLLPQPLHLWQKELAELAPTNLTVPSGSSICLDYCQENGPVLAVKLQELFGLIQNPRVASGPVLIHLLSPAGRPLQVTSDLASFWKNVYPAVRAEMRGRYPKHPWPENPHEARPTRHVKTKSM